MRHHIAFAAVLFVSSLAACAHVPNESVGESAAEYGATVESLGCVTGPECPASSNPCMVAACMWDGSCGAYPMPIGTVCLDGVCDGNGACVLAGPPCNPGPPYPVPECASPGLTGVCLIYSRTCERD